MTVIIAKPTDDLFLGRTDAIVNPVNCVGVMGKGLAAAFRTKFPENTRKYQEHCLQKKMQPGDGLVSVAELNGKSVAIYNLATKNHWRNPSDIQWIVQGARRLLEWAEKNKIYSISCPALGAGLGGLPFAEVQSALTAVFKPSVVVLVLYPPR